MMAEALVAIRLVHFASAMAAFGIGAFRLYAFAGAAAADALARDGFDTLLARAMIPATILALLTALAIVPCVAAEMAGSAALAFDPATANAVMFGTEFGH